MARFRAVSSIFGRLMMRATQERNPSAISGLRDFGRNSGFFASAPDVSVNQQVVGSSPTRGASISKGNPAIYKGLRGFLFPTLIP
jgi:hypothetical protein